MNINEAFGAYRKGTSNKFLVLNIDQFDTWNFINSIKNEGDTKPTIYYDDVDQFFEGVSASFDFSEESKVHVLADTLVADCPLLISSLPYIDDNDVVIILTKKKQSKNKAFSELLSKITYAEPSVVKEHELADNVYQWMLSLDFTISKKAVELLVSKSGVDRFAIHNEVKKLRHYKPDLMINEDDVNAVVQGSAKDDYFEFIDSFMKRKHKDVVAKVCASKSGEYIKMLRGVQTELSKVYRVATLIAAGKDSRAIAERTGYNTFIVRNKYMAHAKRLGKNRISKMISILADAESRMKGSQLDSRSIIEYFMLRAISF